MYQSWSLYCSRLTFSEYSICHCDCETKTIDTGQNQIKWVYLRATCIIYHQGILCQPPMFLRNLWIFMSFLWCLSSCPSQISLSSSALSKVFPAMFATDLLLQSLLQGSATTVVVTVVDMKATFMVRKPTLVRAKQYGTCVIVWTEFEWCCTALSYLKESKRKRRGP